MGDESLSFFQMNQRRLIAPGIIIVLNLLASCTYAQVNGTSKFVAKAQPHAKVCGDVRVTLFEVRRGLDIDALASCEIILGSIIFAPMPSSTSNTNGTTSPFIHFPLLREVYGYMLLGYSTVRSFASMFPRLAIIHGRELYHGYALIIMENLQLDDLGLSSLLSIRSGSVIIARNAQLCYAKSIRWNDIIENKKARIILRQNRDECAFCPTCPLACWAPNRCQQQCSTHCPRNCFSESLCCPEQCIGGCYYSNASNTNLLCNACRHMRVYATGKCVQQCPVNMLKVSGSLCIKPEECASFFPGVGLILNETRECVSSCPSGFDLVTNSSCIRCISKPENNYCQGACREKHIRSVADFATLRYCSRVHTLNIYYIAATEPTAVNLIEALTALASLEQIDHEFTLHSVNVFSTLSVFKRLRRIGTSDNATISIEENDFLADLWPLTQPPPLLQGNLNIIRNARLCRKHIEELISYSIQRQQNLQVTENTRNEFANGYLASCESSLLTLSTDKILSSTAHVIVALPQELFLRNSGKADYLRQPFLSVYYKATRSTRNETHFDTTQSHKWLRLVEKVNYIPTPRGASFTMDVDLSGLLGDTWYAVYASITSNVNTVGLFSPIGYFRTLTRQPEPILNLRGDALSRSSIELVWQPPSKPNGPIQMYLIYYAPIEDRLPTNNSKLLCATKDGWRSSVTVSSSNLNMTSSSSRCSRRLSTDNGNLDEDDDDIEEESGIDQAVADLAILEYQLINSVTQRKDALFVRPDLKETIINELDIYFDKSSIGAIEQQKNQVLQEDIIHEHSPHINTFNRTFTTTKAIIDGLNYAQMYMFQIYACHDITNQSLSDACSLNGIIITVRTKPGDASLDLVHNVSVNPAAGDALRLTSDTKTIDYQISWLPPLSPNGLVYFYTTHIDQGDADSSGPKDDRCVGEDMRSINATLLPRTTYRLRIITYTIARLTRQYDEIEQHSLNDTTLVFQIFFTTLALPSREMTRQNKIALFVLILCSSLLFIAVFVGAPIYYYKYGRGEAKASISKNPNYELYTPDKWEIDKDAVTLDKLIGQGHFGQVYKGVLKLSDGTLKSCAVKFRTTQPTDLLKEACIMKQFQSYHVIQLYGICSRIRPPYVVMELMENGDLKNYLYRHRNNELNTDGSILSESAMIQLALDIADGMYYLSDLKFVHRDLAARNCLVNGNHTCKVGDFGLTRDIYETDYYRRGGRSFLPIRWMAPESLRDGRFDTVSDVWSYGVLLWEIATLAEQPYQGYGNEEVVHYVRYGNITLERPQNCPEILHKLMRACWAFTPTDRISFRSIVDELVIYENEDFHLHAYYHTQPTRPFHSIVNGDSHHEEEDLLLGDDGEDDDSGLQQRSITTTPRIS